MVGFLKAPGMNRIVRGSQAAQPLPSFTSSSAGLTYCAIDALAFLHDGSVARMRKTDHAGSSDVSLDDCSRWILALQTTYIEEDEPETEEQSAKLPPSKRSHLPSSPLGTPDATHFLATPHSPSKATASAQMQNAKAPILDCSEENLRWAGFSGRSNKIADTCYCFWNAGALAVRVLRPFRTRNLLTEPNRCCVDFTSATKPGCDDICSKKHSI